MKTFAEYQQAARRTMAGKFPTTSVQQLAVHSLGLTGEAGEVADMVKKFIGHGHPVDSEKFEKELGDVLWYLAALCEWFNLTLEEVAAANIEKLRKRYPDGFSEQASRERAE